MNNNRLAFLLQFFEEDSNDPFNAYALAMEYQQTDVTKAAEYFQLLLEQHPDYLPTYYHAAALFAELEQLDLAEQLYQKGMQLALSQQNTKTYQELQRAYRGFQDEYLS
ncbi:tetratricopeptide repeat protein [Runella salmonicolor]|uniref:Tetratricopeptide repeat protein n=1 Tax=Runella salmonicolor TaxID=2950278 RepID=A0ABT1FP25_9BACT|nr:tetratricopeptide repeat protein [Runella salmonicolor]MCP1382308.1 tetratricopeptide repeat protein [Runella salmonicolor]